MTDVFVDPSVAGPDVQFSTGTVMDGAEQFAAALPDIAGSADPGWNITQWNTPADQIFDPTAPILADPEDDDLLLGAAVASWHTGTAASGSGLVVYGAPGDVTFRLSASGGANRDTFLQTTGYAPGTVTFDHPLIFTAEERLASAATTGDGTAIAFNSFTVFFNASDNPGYNPRLATDEIFLQVPLTDFRGEPAPYQTIAKGDYYQTIYNLSSQSYDQASKLVSDMSVNALAFAADDGALHTVRIDLNQALLRLVDQMAAQDPDNAASYQDLSDWSLGSVYAGVETAADAGSATLSLDIAHPVVSQDSSQTVSASLPLSTVQSIDGNAYANLETAGLITTRAGTSNDIVLAGAGQKTVTSLGTDQVTLGSEQTVTLHADGAALTVIGQMTVPGTVAIDGSAPINLSGAFGALAIDSAAPGDVIDGSASGDAQLDLGGADATIDLTGTASAMLSGPDDALADNGGTISLAADGDRIDLNGNGSQTVFLNGHSAQVTESGIGAQTIVAAPDMTGELDVAGGLGAQTIWTGGTSAQVTASAGGPHAAMAVYAQPGSSTSVSLGGETTMLDDMGGNIVATGGSDPSGHVSLYGGAGSMVLWGGAETAVASAGDSAAGMLQVGAGSGDQTIFGGLGTVTVIGSHSTAGSQTIVDGSDPGASTTIFGGLTRQTIWTGAATDTIVSSNMAADSSGSIQAFIQGGASSYWAGSEQASLDNQDGLLQAFLQGDGKVSILAEMTGTTTTILHGFANAQDTLVLGGVSDPSAVQLVYAGGNAALTVAGTGASVLLAGVTHVDLAQVAGGVGVTI